MPNPTCKCGECPLCTGRGKSYREKTPEERRAWVAQRDPVKVRALDRRRYERDKPKRRAAAIAYAQTERGKAALRRANKKWMAANPEKRRAQNAVANAIRDGKLVKGSCAEAGPDCKGWVHGHHHDYSKLLEVEWLCDHHHKLRHKED